MNSRGALLTAGLAIAIAIGSPASSEACATCFGASDSGMTQGMNNAILLLLGVVGVVQGGFIALFVKFWRGASPQAIEVGDSEDRRRSTDG